MRDQTSVRGILEVRPWRVGLLVDVENEEEVRAALSSLAAVWGGRFLPVLSRSASVDDLVRAGRRYQLDSLFTDGEVSPQVQELLLTPGYSWRGRRQWGPFADLEDGFGKGLLKLEEMRSEKPKSSTSPAPQGLLDLIVWAANYPSSIDVDEHLVLRHWYNQRPPTGLWVVDEASPRSIVNYWNARSIGGRLFPLSTRSEEFNARMLDVYLTRESPDLAGVVPVMNIADLDPGSRRHLIEAGSRSGVTIADVTPPGAEGVDSWFPGFEPVRASRFRIEATSASPSFIVSFPELPFLRKSHYYTGIVAVEVHPLGDEGLDPRLTLAIPPHRRHAKLLEPSLAFGSEHVRVSPRGSVFAVHAGAEEVTVPIASNLEVMRLLFDDPRVRVSQSAEGRFQSRSAEMLGGTAGAAATHPGLRAAIERIGRQSGGVTLQEIRATVENARGDWPDRLFALRSTAASKEYADRMTNFLLNSGLVVAMMDAQCSFCRVTSHIEANALSSKPQCEFCGHEFNLALSLALTKPTWRYRLAGHISADKVQAMLPVVASLATLAQLRNVEGPRLASVLGLEVDLPGEGASEIDIATVLHEDNWIVVLGEVKSHNRIDAVDVAHLGALQRYLWKKDVQSVILFATLKDEYGEIERRAIRRVAEVNARFVQTRHPGVKTVVTPLVWTGRNVSLPWDSDDHPWRWGKPGEGLGIYGIAQESCRRNLQLTGWRDDGNVDGVELLWARSTIDGAGNG